MSVGVSRCAHLLNRSWGEVAEGGSGEDRGREEAAKGAAQAGRRRRWRPLRRLCVSGRVGALVLWLCVSRLVVVVVVDAVVVWWQ